MNSVSTPQPLGYVCNYRNFRINDFLLTVVRIVATFSIAFSQFFLDTILGRSRVSSQQHRLQWRKIRRLTGGRIGTRTTHQSVMNEGMESEARSRLSQSNQSINLFVEAFDVVR